MCAYVYTCVCKYAWRYYLSKDALVPYTQHTFNEDRVVYNPVSHAYVRMYIHVYVSVFVETQHTSKSYIIIYIYIYININICQVGGDDRAYRGFGLAGMAVHCVRKWPVAIPEVLGHRSWKNATVNGVKVHKRPSAAACRVRNILFSSYFPTHTIKCSTAACRVRNILFSYCVHHTHTYHRCGFKVHKRPSAAACRVRNILFSYCIHHTHTVDVASSAPYSHAYAYTHLTCTHTFRSHLGHHGGIKWS
jgi:hypothetical protein